MPTLAPEMLSPATLATNPAAPTTARSITARLARWPERGMFSVSFGLHHGLLIAAACLLAAWVTPLNFVMHDMFHEMAVARQWILYGQLPLDNPFAFTPTLNPSVHHEWAMGVLLYGYCVSTGWGTFGLTVLRWMLIAGTTAAVYSTARRRGAHPITFALLSVLVLPMVWIGMGTLRAQLVTLLFTAVQLRLMDEDRQGRRGWGLLLFPLWFVWINIHAGVLVGIGLLGIDTCERIAADIVGHRSRHLKSNLSHLIHRIWRRNWHRFGLLLSVVPLLFSTPYGVAYIPYLLHAVPMHRPTISEWGPLWTTYDPGLTMACFITTVCLSAWATVRLGWRRTLGGLALLVTAYLALRHLRHGSIYAVVWMSYAPALLGRTDPKNVIPRWVLQRQRFAMPLALLVSIGAMGYVFAHRGLTTVLPVQHEHFGDANQPAGASEYLKTNGFRGRLLTPFGAGAYVMWHLYPDVLISLDGRYETAYPLKVYDDHYELYAGSPQYQQIIDRYPCDALLASQQSKLTPLLRTDPRWRLVYQDDVFCIFIPDGPESTNGSGLPIVDRRGEPLPETFLRDA